jgi:hypothetical protein
MTLGGAPPWLYSALVPWSELWSDLRCSLSIHWSTSSPRCVPVSSVLPALPADLEGSSVALPVGGACGSYGSSFASRCAISCITSASSRSRSAAFRRWVASA